jgi:hypothetical protein
LSSGLEVLQDLKVCMFVFLFSVGYSSLGIKVFCLYFFV